MQELPYIILVFLFFITALIFRNLYKTVLKKYKALLPEIKNLEAKLTKVENQKKYFEMLSISRLKN